MASAAAFVAPFPDKAAALFSELSAEHARSGRFRTTMMRAQATAILALLLRAAPDAAAHRHADPRLTRFEAIVAAHLHDGGGVAEYAGALALSPRHPGRLCRDGTGQSVQAFVTAERLREACRLLAYTPLPVQGVAFQRGFDDPSYLSRVFQRQIGTSPRAYRAGFEVEGSRRRECCDQRGSGRCGAGETGACDQRGAARAIASRDQAGP